MIQEEREIKWSSDADVLCLAVAIELEWYLGSNPYGPDATRL
jgi:hypothetical protein